MMTAEFMLSKRPVLRFTAALFFLLTSTMLNLNQKQHFERIKERINVNCFSATLTCTYLHPEGDRVKTQRKQKPMFHNFATANLSVKHL